MTIYYRVYNREQHILSVLSLESFTSYSDPFLMTSICLRTVYVMFAGREEGRHHFCWSVFVHRK